MSLAFVNDLDIVAVRIEQLALRRQRQRGRIWATTSTFTQTAKMNGLDPETYLP
jgi:hypothetical protein